MSNHSAPPQPIRVPASVSVGPIVVLSVMLAIIMPAIEAYLFPTYMHEMLPAWVEGARLYEIPYVLFAAATVVFAVSRGLNLSTMVGSLPRDVAVAAALLVVGILAGSVFVSNQKLLSTAASCITLVTLLFTLSAFHLARGSNERALSLVLPLHAAGLAMLAIYTAWRFSFPPAAETVRGGVIEWSAAVPGFISVRHLGSWAGAIAAGFAARILFGHDKRKWGWDDACYLLAASLTVWSGTRAAVLAMAVVTTILIVSTGRWPSHRAIARAAMLTGAAMAIAYPLLPDDPAFHLFATRDYHSVQTATSARSSLWELTFLRWLESPIFGWGTASTLWEVDIGTPNTQPHNAVLQFLISWGVIGCGGAVYLLGRAIGRVHGPGIRDPQLRPLVAMLYALLFQSLLEGMLHYPRFVLAIFFLFALLIAEADRVESRTRPSTG